MRKKQTTFVKIDQYLKRLHLPAIRDSYREQADLARKESLPYESYLLELLERETENRHNNRVQRYLRESNLSLEKNMETFDLKRLPPTIGMQVKSLLDGDFIDRRENILAFGNPGSGKTHLLSAIAQELIVKHEKRIYSRTCCLLVQELLAAKRDLELARYMKKLSKFDVILIDDIGYIQQGREEMEVLFSLLSERYERGSVMITSNLPFSKWEGIFKDPITTAAAIDRVIHHSVILELNASSYRAEVAKKRKTAKKKRA